jgi:tetratricopeptide (TPR) repeat protein
MVRNADGRPEMRNETSAVAHLEAGRHVHIMTEAAAPEDTVNLQPGTYRVRAVLETPFWMFWGWRGRVASAPVTIVVVDPSKTGDRRNALETQRLMRAGDFYIGVARFEEAARAAREVVKSEPNQIEAHILLGDALVGLERRQEALAAYHRALALVPRSYEQPTLLYERIQSVLHHR